jgi:hypothetical protein
MTGRVTLINLRQEKPNLNYFFFLPKNMKKKYYINIWNSIFNNKKYFNQSKNLKLNYFFIKNKTVSIFHDIIKSVNYSY